MNVVELLFIVAPNAGAVGNRFHGLGPHGGTQEESRAGFPRELLFQPLKPQQFGVVHRILRT